MLPLPNFKTSIPGRGMFGISRRSKARKTRKPINGTQRSMLRQANNAVCGNTNSPQPYRTKRVMPISAAQTKNFRDNCARNEAPSWVRPE